MGIGFGCGPVLDGGGGLEMRGRAAGVRWGALGGGRKSEGGFVPGGSPIDRDFAQDFIALQQRGRTEAAWLVGGRFEASRGGV